MKHLFTLSERLKGRGRGSVTSAISATSASAIFCKLVGMVKLFMPFMKATKRQCDTTIFAESLKSLMSIFAESAESAESAKPIFANRGVKDVRVSLDQSPTNIQRISNLYLTPNRYFTRFAAVFALVFVLGVGNVWGEKLILTFDGSTNAYSIVSSASTSQNTFTEGTTTIGYKSCSDATASNKHYIMFAKGAGVLYNTTAIPGKITNIKVYYRSGTSTKSNFGVKCGTSVMNSRQTSSVSTLTTTSGGSDDCDFAESSNFTYFNISVQGGTSSSYGNIQVTKIEVTYAATSSNPLSSISVQTAPTKVKYVAEENFDPTGLIITRNYSSGSPDTYTYASHTSEFSFTPSTSTALTTSNTSVSITYGGKSTSQAINVYNVTMQARDEDGNAIPSGGPGAPTRSGKNITSAEDANNYIFKEWQITNASLGSSKTTKSNTIINPTGAVTVTAVYYKPIPVSWNKNGSLYETTYTGYNQKPVFPEAPSSCDLTSNTFYGWATSTWDNPIDNLAGKTVYTSADGMPNVTAAGTTYNAVFAKGTATVTPVANTWTRITSTSQLTDGATVMLVQYYSKFAINNTPGATACTANAEITNSTASLRWIAEKSGTKWKFKTSGGAYLSTNALDNNTNLGLNQTYDEWTISADNGGTTGSNNTYTNTNCFRLNNGSDLEYYNNTFKLYAWSLKYSSAYPFYIYIQKTTSTTTYSQYLTSCCTPLAQVEGSANLSQWNAGVHIY